MTDKATLQSYDRSKVERSRLLSLDLETLDGPTYPLLHQEARFLYVLRGSGVIELQGKPLELRPGALLGMLPWQVSNVTAVSELKITPAKDTGFAKIAQKIAKFPQVEACFLMSGAYDLLVFVNGASLQEVALFVSGQLSTIEGVLSTATHFMLKTYKAKGLLADFAPDRRLPVV